MERETGIEPATSSLGSWRSTAELLPLTTVAEPRLPPIKGQLQCRAILKHAEITGSGRLVRFREQCVIEWETANGKNPKHKFKRVAIPAAIAGSS